MPAADDILSDDQLAARTRDARSLADFEELVRRFQTPLLHFLSRRFASRRDLEDVLQDTFLKAWQSLHLYNPRQSFRAWLYTIAYRTAVSHGRRDRPAVLLSPAIPATILAPHQNAQDQDDRQALWQLARAILTEDQFTALWLHYVDDLPAPDIARILNLSWVNIKTLLHRARKKLKPHLASRHSHIAPGMPGKTPGQSNKAPAAPAPRPPETCRNPPNELQPAAGAS